MSRQQKILDYLKARGCWEVVSPSRKYICLARNTFPGEFYFLGKNGAVRAGRTVSDSVSVTSYFRRPLVTA